MSGARFQFYSLYERIWHWCQALAIGLLLLTGLALHARGLFGWVPFDAAIQTHNIVGFLLIGNAALGLFYYITTGTIRQYVPDRNNFVSHATRQANFYLGGIFRDEPHPVEKSPKRRLNPLQQMTYLLTLNGLLVLQIVTGLLMWSLPRWPQIVNFPGEMAVLAAIHTLGAWLFASFALMHIYLTTTGHTPLANLKAMVLGYEDVQVQEKADEMAS
jgi:thiosulfate reductase cytochrome b subunit